MEMLLAALKVTARNSTRFQDMPCRFFDVYTFNFALLAAEKYARRRLTSAPQFLQIAKRIECNWTTLTQHNTTLCPPSTATACKAVLFCNMYKQPLCDDKARRDAWRDKPAKC